MLFADFSVLVLLFHDLQLQCVTSSTVTSYFCLFLHLCSTSSTLSEVEQCDLGIVVLFEALYVIHVRSLPRMRRDAICQVDMHEYPQIHTD